MGGKIEKYVDYETIKINNAAHRIEGIEYEKFFCSREYEKEIIQRIKHRTSYFGLLFSGFRFINEAPKIVESDKLYVDKEFDRDSVDFKLADKESVVFWVPSKLISEVYQNIYQIFFQNCEEETKENTRSFFRAEIYDHSNPNMFGNILMGDYQSSYKFKKLVERVGIENIHSNFNEEFTYFLFSSCDLVVKMSDFENLVPLTYTKSEFQDLKPSQKESKKLLEDVEILSCIGRVLIKLKNDDLEEYTKHAKHPYFFNAKSLAKKIRSCGIDASLQTIENKISEIKQSNNT